jgi:hypothetical protein
MGESGYGLAAAGVRGGIGALGIGRYSRNS